ncbi:hypothetical protein GTA08_BOTSDO13970 [Botryosphaeria dothidea]|uniref:Uncharacterized protein n=1 Tax=Botryosphaeria dothidea TaxID=55169 RepID=A0A8H4N650_9PEZI|nr:hypothetical protein GTA08_BOTSDO13970 [Botryosphaeria dothidea]
MDKGVFGPSAPGENPSALWKLSKWARTRALEPPAPPQFPPLQGADGQLRYDNQSKAEILINQFFPPPRATDLSDLDGCTYPVPVEIPQDLAEEQVIHTIKKLPPDKAPGPDKIINRDASHLDTTLGSSKALLP